MFSTTASFSDDDYASFCRRLRHYGKFYIADYKSDQMRRRVSTFVEQAHCNSYTEFALLLEQNPSERKRFISELTIHVTSLMRNPQMFDHLITEILPMIPCHATNEPFNVWSAGCSYGAEVFSAAVVLREAMPHRRVAILGTDVDSEVLARAADPSFSAEDMANVSATYRARSFRTLPNGMCVPAEHLKRCARFECHDLLRDPYPVSQFDLILCRNVAIYFTEAAKQRVFAKLALALKPGGVLFLGSTERIPRDWASGLTCISPFFYRRPGTQSMAA